MNPVRLAPVVILLLASALAEVTETESSIEIMGDGARLLLQCKNRDVEVTGTNNVVEFSDRCRSISIMGDSNRVVVQEVAKVEITGVNNRLGYRRFVNGVEGRRPSQEVSGTGNVIYRVVEGQPSQLPAARPTSPASTSGAKPPAPANNADINVTGFGSTSTQDCGQGRSVRVEGSNLTVNLRGYCRKVQVEGMGNTVNIETVSNIAVTGSMNKVFWRRGADSKPPTVSNTGLNNQVAQRR